MFLSSRIPHNQTRTKGHDKSRLNRLASGNCSSSSSAIVKGTVIQKELARRPIANVRIVDSTHTCGSWARTFNSLGVLDRDQSQVEEARDALAEALQIYRELAEKNPETYRSELAETLNNLGLLDSNHGRLEEARKEYVEALQIRRELAEKNPEPTGLT